MSLANLPIGHGTSNKLCRAAFDELIQIEKSIEKQAFLISVASPIRPDGTFLERTDLVDQPPFAHLFEFQELLADKFDELYDWWLEQLVDLHYARAAGGLVKW